MVRACVACVRLSQKQSVCGRLSENEFYQTNAHSKCFNLIKTNVLICSDHLKVKWKVPNQNRVSNYFFDIICLIICRIPLLKKIRHVEFSVFGCRNRDFSMNPTLTSMSP